MPFLGEEGTEQFEVETLIDGKSIRVQKVHDPFAHTTITIVPKRWELLKLLMRPKPIKVQTIVRGSRAATSRIMMLDPVEMQRDEENLMANASTPTRNFP